MKKTVKIACLPHAGASASIYYRWKKYAFSAIDFIPIELAGRGFRINESLYPSFDIALLDIYKELQGKVNGDHYALFGHSMGGLFAYELSLLAKKTGFNIPITVFISGQLPPHIETGKRDLHNLPEDEFKKELMKYGGITEEHYRDRELWAHYEPILRADLRIIETRLKKKTKDKIDSDIIVMYGDTDEILTSEIGDMNYDIDEWKEYTNQNYKSYVFGGDHFYINQFDAQIVKILVETIKSKNNQD